MLPIRLYTRSPMQVVAKNFERYQKISPAHSPFYPFRFHEAYPGFREFVVLDERTF